ncbi:hypothetical protein, conserved [Eimeria brunetti]|uniref:Uncharacterized protein n=1 Tax=Eimeria brunetti TaxID=51314 RepID=U6LWQ8_9EIME|nr:hypothetical protein, conserved [Eimeria brunetti]
MPSEGPDGSSSFSSRSSQRFVSAGQGLRRRGAPGGSGGPPSSTVAGGPLRGRGGPFPPVLTEGETIERNNTLIRSSEHDKPSVLAPPTDALLNLFAEQQGEERRHPSGGPSGGPPGAPAGAFYAPDRSSAFVSATDIDDSFVSPVSSSDASRRSAQGQEGAPEGGPFGAPVAGWGGLRGPLADDSNQGPPSRFSSGAAAAAAATDARQQQGEEWQRGVGGWLGFIREVLFLLQQLWQQLQQQVYGAAAAWRLGASSFLSACKWLCIMTFVGLLLLGCIGCCFAAAAAVSYSLLFAFSYPPPLHQFPVHLNYTPNMTAALNTAYSKLSTPHQSTDIQTGAPPPKGPPPGGPPPWAPPLGAPLPAEDEDEAAKGEGGGPPPAFSRSTAPAAAAPFAASGGPWHTGAPWGGGPWAGGPWGGANWGGGPSGGAPWWGPPGGPPDSTGPLEEPFAVATVPFSNRTWELLPEDEGLFAAPLPAISSHWQQQQQQQQQQFVSPSPPYLAQEAKVPAFASDVVLSVSLPGCCCSSSSSNSSSSNCSSSPSVAMVYLLLFGREGRLVARSSRPLPNPSACCCSMFAFFSSLFGSSSSQKEIKMMEGLSHPLVSQLQFARVYVHPKLPLLGASLTFLPRPQGLRLFVIEHPYLALLLLTLLLLAAAAAAFLCCCCCCCTYLLTRDREEDDYAQLSGGPPTRSSEGPPPQGAPQAALITDSGGAHTPQLDSYSWGVCTDTPTAAASMQRRASTNN